MIISSAPNVKHAQLLTSGVEWNDTISIGNLHLDEVHYSHLCPPSHEAGAGAAVGRLQLPSKMLFAQVVLGPRLLST